MPAQHRKFACDLINFVVVVFHDQSLQHSDFFVVEIIS